ncbi:MAG TPA: hypothetical protein VJZ73_17040 [Methylomirabilota bacterium]|nr:hypothetical protein [Methylomirabilota bacterium]
MWRRVALPRIKQWSWLLVLMTAGCYTLYDHGSDVHSTGGIFLVYTDWIAPKDARWEKDYFECDQQAREAAPSIVRLPGQRQVIAEKCLTDRGYVRR